MRKKELALQEIYGIAKSNSKNIIFIDSDDLYEKEALSNMMNAMQCNDMVVYGYRRTGDTEKIHCLSEEKNASNIEEVKNIIEELQKADLFNQPCNKVFKSEIIKEYNISFPEEISLGEDYRFVLDYIEKCKKIKVINKVLYIYNRSENGLALRYDDNNLKIRLDNLQYHKKFYIRNNIETDYLDKLYVFYMVSGYAEIVRNNKKKEAKRLLKRYSEDKSIEKQLGEIKNKKLKLFVIVLKIKNVGIKYLLGKTYNLAKKIIKK